MHDLVRLSAGLLILFFSSLILSYGLTRLIRRSNLRLEPGTTVQFRTATGLYRSRFLGAGRDGWQFSAPLQRDSFVPLRVGEPMTVQATGAGGVLSFRSRVIDRQMTTHDFMLAPPERVVRTERRATKRVPCQGATGEIEGRPAFFTDLSRTGARLECQTAAERGERVSIRTPGGEVAPAWVLEALPVGERGSGLVALRLVFEEPLKS